MHSSSLILLLTETFEPVADSSLYSYSDEGASLLETLASLNATQASKSVVPGGTTIAGHAHHIRFFTEFVLQRMRGNLDDVNWDLSWSVREVDEMQWTAIQADLRTAYLACKTPFAEHIILDEKNERRAMAIVVHAAYHVGAIRQMIKLVR